MSDIRSKLNAFYSLEQLSAGKTAVHRLHPGAKLAAVFFYLLCMMSLGRYETWRLSPFLFFPVLMTAAADLPYGMLLKRAAAALPFCICAGVSGMFFEQTPAMRIGPVFITFGFLSMLTLIIRTFLSVWMVVILTACTPFRYLTDQLRRIHVPEILVSLLEMVWRYAGILIEEAADMVAAFRLRSGGRSWPSVSEFPALAGQLLLRSADRAERVSQAMQCRLYRQAPSVLRELSFGRGEFLFLIAACGSSLCFRLFDLPELLGGIFG